MRYWDCRTSGLVHLALELLLCLLPGPRRPWGPYRLSSFPTTYWANVKELDVGAIDLTKMQESFGLRVWGKKVGAEFTQAIEVVAG